MNNYPQNHINITPLGGNRGTLVGRFAPSPTGRMHMGNVYSALLAWLSARCKGGRFILRIEDIDQQRSRNEYAEQIDDDLAWLGLDWDERYVQSERFDVYEAELCKLTEKGLTYNCYCTRADIMASSAPHESDGRIVHSIAQRILDIKKSGNHLPSFDKGVLENFPPLQESNGEIVRSIRLMVPDKNITFCDGHYGEHTVNLASQCGDFVLRRADGAWAYQLAVVVDDALMGITEVVRGRDLLLSVPQQMYLYQQLGYQSPQFCHLPLLCNENGQRLSKRDKSLDMSELRRKYSPEQIIGQLAYYAGIIPELTPITAKNLIPLFSWDKVPLSDIVIK